MNQTRRWPKIMLVMLLLITLSPTLPAEMDVRQIQALMNEGKLDQALREADGLLARDKSNIQALFIKGLVLTRMDQLAKAEEIFLELNRINPELPEPYNNLAVIYASRGEYDKAREALLGAINTHPSYATAHENIGDIYAKLASQAYNQALELDSGNAAAREKLSLVNELFSVPAASSSTSQLASAAPVTSVPTRPEPEPEITPAVIPPAPEPETVPEPKPVPEPLPVATASPAPPPSTPAPAAATSVEEDTLVTEAITSSVTNWARAWSGQDVEGYLSWYAKDYTPGPDISRPDWEAQRQARLSSPESINVGISGLKVIRHGDEHAQATFVQDYQSDTYHDTVNKTLLFRLLNGRWLIVQEKSDS